MVDGNCTNEFVYPPALQLASTATSSPDSLTTTAKRLERFTRVDSDTSSAATAVTSAASTSAVSSSTYAQLPASDKTTWLEDPAAWDHFCSVLTSIYALLLLYLRWWLSYRKIYAR
uniref:Uncharacterized protein n=1 Tax=Ditylenchus dipsaci TaxID=166011 RepID=A0A915DWW1_9BILA